MTIYSNKPGFGPFPFKTFKHDTGVGRHKNKNKYMVIEVGLQF